MTPPREWVAKVEAFAPPHLAPCRRRLWRDLAAELGTVDPANAEINLAGILRALVIARQIERATEADTSRRKNEAGYWKSRDALGQQLKRLEDHPLIRHFPSAAVRFYEPGQVRCPHGRHRRKCESIRAYLELWNEMVGLSSLGVVQKLGLLGRPSSAPSRLAARWPIRRANEVGERVVAMGVDPDKSSPDDFCRPLPDDEPLPSLRPKPQGGRPLDAFRRFLLEAVVGSLTELKLPVERSAEFLEHILATCFDEKVDAAALVRQWMRVKREAEAPS